MPTGGGFCAHGSEDISSFTKGAEFVDQLDNSLLKKDDPFPSRSSRKYWRFDCFI